MAMSFWDWVILLVVAGVCGAVGQAIAGVSRGGCLVSIAVGFIGALLGMWLHKLTGLPEIFLLEVGDTKFPIIWSIIGSVLFVAVVSLLTRRGRRDRV
jgi:uncharacterized membrane protein YeaQ/YmgE (transglycosylase-associated protein family)